MNNAGPWPNPFTYGDAHSCLSFPLRNAIMKRVPLGRDKWYRHFFGGLACLLVLLLTTPRGDWGWLFAEGCGSSGRSTTD